MHGASCPRGLDRSKSWCLVACELEPGFHCGMDTNKAASGPICSISIQVFPINGTGEKSARSEAMVSTLCTTRTTGRYGR